MHTVRYQWQERVSWPAKIARIAWEIGLLPEALIGCRIARANPLQRMIARFGGVRPLTS